MTRSLRFSLALLVSTGALVALGMSPAGDDGRGTAGAGEKEVVAMKPGQGLELYSVEKQQVVAMESVTHSEEEWRKVLSKDQFQVLRQKGTERAFSGQYAHTETDGIYRCAGCGNDLYDSRDKFDSGTGWPSFTRPVAPGNVETKADRGFFTTRTEVLCRRCGGHLGHVFDDGPAPTGMRHCMNSAALALVPRPAPAK